MFSLPLTIEILIRGWQKKYKFPSPFILQSLSNKPCFSPDHTMSAAGLWGHGLQMWSRDTGNKICQTLSWPTIFIEQIRSDNSDKLRCSSNKPDEAWSGWLMSLTMTIFANYDDVTTPYFWGRFVVVVKNLTLPQHKLKSILTVVFFDMSMKVHTQPKPSRHQLLEQVERWN